MRAMVAAMKTQGCSERRSCMALSVDRSSIRYECREPDAMEAYLVKLMTYWAMRCKRYGYRRVERRLRAEGHVVNHKKAYRLWTTYGMTLNRRRRRRRRGESKFARAVNATRPNEVWCLDFMHDRTQYGVKLKYLNALDEYSREAVTIRVQTQIKSVDVTAMLDEAIMNRMVRGDYRGIYTLLVRLFGNDLTTVSRPDERQKGRSA